MTNIRYVVNMCLHRRGQDMGKGTLPVVIISTTTINHNNNNISINTVASSGNSQHMCAAHSRTPYMILLPPKQQFNKVNRCLARYSPRATTTN